MSMPPGTGSETKKEITLFKSIKYIDQMYTKHTEIYKWWIRDVARPHIRS